MGSASTLDYCDRTDIGRRRSNNQDSKAVLAPWNADQYAKVGWLFVVADGMGAHAAGEMASAIAAEQVPLVYGKLAARSPPLALRTSIEQANAEIHAKGQSSVDLKGMGTTCTVLVIVPRGALVGHVGDSRAYRVRGGRIEQLSRDHSLAWELEDLRAAGEIKHEQVLRDAPKNVITRSMGPHAQIKVDLEGPFSVRADDVFVLCSDGLSGQVTDEEIGLFAAGLRPREAAEALVGLALIRGAPDNVTVIVARAGEQEVTRASAGGEPWQLTEGATSQVDNRLPWRMLGIAAASLFVALVSASFVAGRVGDSGTLRGGVAFALSAFAALAFLGSLLAAILGFLVPPSSGTRVLPAGKKLGEGPYRSYDCTPGQPLIEGVLQSIVSCAEGLYGAGRSQAVAGVGRAREKLAAHDVRAAVHEVAAAIAVYTRSVEATRAGDPSGAGPFRDSNRSALEP